MTENIPLQMYLERSLFYVQWLFYFIIVRLS